MTSQSKIVLAAFLFGLGLGVHLTSIALLAPALAVWLTTRYGWRFWRSRTAWFAALALVGGAAIYLYLPLAAAADPLLNWGQPDSWQRFWWHVTARQYRVSLLSAPVWPQVVQAAQLWWTQFTPLGLALLLLGAWRMARTHRALFITLLLIVVCVTLYAWAYVIEDDGDAYYLPAFLAGAVWVAWGAEWVVGWLASWLAGGLVGWLAGWRADAIRPYGSGIFGTGRTVGSIIPMMATVSLLAIVPIVALVMNWGACDRRFDTIPEDYVRDTFAEIGVNGLLLTRDWQLYSPALYLQHVEGLRGDLTVIDTELLRRDWYFGLLRRIAPDLMASVAAEERVFRQLRDAWERGELPDGDPRIGQLQAAYVALLDAFIRQATAAGRPVHVGPNRGAEALRPATLRGQPDMERGVGAGWRWTPVGLTFRVGPPEAALPPLAPLNWQVTPFRHVFLTPPERKIQATRADMATLRGLFQAQAGNLMAAEADWRVALSVDPSHGPAQEYLRRLGRP